MPSVNVSGLRRGASLNRIWLEIRQLEDANRARDARALARLGARRFPQHALLFRLREALTLPVLYDSTQHVRQERARLDRALRHVSSVVKLDSPAARRSALLAVGHHDTFLLAYQGEDDARLQRLYGELVARVTQANYPAWSASGPRRPGRPGRRIRVGYASSHFYGHTVTKLFGGWIANLDRRTFDLFTYHVASRVDGWTPRVTSRTTFRHVPDNLERACRMIAGDQLDVIVYLDIGMSGLIKQMASLRLAPVQCATWGHPMTTGLPTIDYFISSAAMEPPGAAAHYTETLVALPGVGVCVKIPPVPGRRECSRREFGLAHDAVVYLSPQSSYKYLPQYDRMYVDIAGLVPNSLFVFVEMNRAVGASFAARMRKAFTRAGLDFDARCRVLPRMDTQRYWRLHRIADVFLDTPGWSGGVSTFEAVACGLPIVTLQGPYMRGRHSAAILRQLGVAETIARHERRYIDIAVALGRRRQRRTGIAARMAANLGALFEDRRSVRALEDFFRAARSGDERAQSR